MYKLSITGKVLPDGKTPELHVGLTHAKSENFAEFNIAFNIECISEDGKTVGVVQTERQVEITDEEKLANIVEACVFAGRIGNWETTQKITHAFAQAGEMYSVLDTDIRWKENVDRAIKEYLRAAA